LRGSFLGIRASPPIRHRIRGDDAYPRLALAGPSARLAI
jgi:hypothetical protein